jgi:hypothetical protein
MASPARPNARPWMAGPGVIRAVKSRQGWQGSFFFTATRARLRAVPSLAERVVFRLQASYFLVYSHKKVTKEGPPRNLRPLIAKEEAR